MQLELQHLSKTFGPLRANHDINVTFEEGKIYALLGENGAGKSTLMKIIAGYQAPDAGSRILIDGRPVRISSPSDALAQGIGMLYQDPLDFPPMTVLENYLTARPGQGLLPRWQAARAELLAIAERFGFSLNPDDLIESLTIGARQQLEIVRLLSLKVQFLILDEPTTGISAKQRGRLFSTLKQLAHRDGLSIVLVTHKLEDVEELCDEVLVLRHGRVTGSCTMPTPAATLVEMMFGQAQPADPAPTLPLGRPLLQVQGLHLHSHLLDIRDIDLELRAGEVIGLAGLDGSGQNLFMRACAGLDRVSWRDHALSVGVFGLLLLFFEYLLGYSATMFIITMLILAALLIAPFLLRWLQALRAGGSHISFDGRPTLWQNYRDLRRQGLAYLSAGRLEEGLVTGMTLTQHFALAGSSPSSGLAQLGSFWINWWAALRRTQQAIRTYDIRGQAFSPIQTLSGGNQQRVALALLPDNLKLAFLQNPTRGLDVNSARHIWSLLLQTREKGTAIVFSSPDLDEIVRYSDRVLVFSSGRVTLVDDPAQINPQHLGLLIGGKHSA